MALPERLTIRSLYLYLVCLVTLVIALFAAVNLVRSTVALLYPDPGYGYFEPVERGGLDPEQQQLMEEQARESQRRYEILDMVGSGATLLIVGPLYLYHWRRVQSELTPPPVTPAQDGSAA